MKRVVHTEHDAYSTVPSWTLTLDCGHIVNFRTSKGDTQTRPPTTFDCALCASGKERTKQNKEDEIMSDKIKAEVGTVTMFACATHVCVEVDDKHSTWFAKLASVVVDETRPCGYRSLGKQIVERRNIGATLTQAVGSRETFKPMTEQQVKDFLAANAVDARAEDTAETTKEKGNDMSKKKAVKVKAVKQKVKTPKALAAGTRPRATDEEAKNVIKRVLKADDKATDQKCVDEIRATGVGCSLPRVTELRKLLK